MLNMKNPLLALKCLAAASCLLMLNACATGSSGKFACPAPDGFSCMNPVEVYEATNDMSNADEQPRVKKGGKLAPQTIVVQPVAPAVAEAVAVGPDCCCNPVLTGLSVGKNDSLSLARPMSPIVPTQRQADALNRGTRASPQLPDGEAYRESAKIMRIYVAPGRTSKEICTWAESSIRKLSRGSGG